MPTVNSFGQIHNRVRRFEARSTFPKVVRAVEASPSVESVGSRAPPADAPPPANAANAPPPNAPPDGSLGEQLVVGEVTQGTALFDGDAEIAWLTSGRYVLSYPMKRVGDDVRMRAKVVDAVTGELAWRWMTVFRETPDGARTRCVAFSSA